MWGDGSDNACRRNRCNLSPPPRGLGHIVRFVVCKGWHGTAAIPSILFLGCRRYSLSLYRVLLFKDPTSGFWLRRALAPIARNPLFDALFLLPNDSLCNRIRCIHEKIAPAEQCFDTEVVKLVCSERRDKHFVTSQCILMPFFNFFPVVADDF